MSKRKPGRLNSAEKAGIGLNNVNKPQEAIDQVLLGELNNVLVEFVVTSIEPFRLHFLFRFILERITNESEAIDVEKGVRTFDLLNNTLSKAHPKMRGAINAQAHSFKAQLKNRSLKLRDLAKHRLEVDNAVDDAGIVATVLEGQNP